ncbi:MAG TPA: hypothetical protein PKC87_00650 [Candidatus Absconditabacterales bacterium]|nr:hypothetical protein [Candidatus Absconditabacterales bacterium]
MKVEQFKKLLKEAVREVLKEELPKLLSEQVRPIQKQPQVTKYEPYKKPIVKVQPSGHPIADLLRETHLEMTRQPVTFNASNHSTLGMEGNDMMLEEAHIPSEQPGLDISQFDFVKNAAAIFKASQEKDRQRFGG